MVYWLTAGVAVVASIAWWIYFRKKYQRALLGHVVLLPGERVIAELSPVVLEMQTVFASSFQRRPHSFVRVTNTRVILAQRTLWSGADSSRFLVLYVLLRSQDAREPEGATGGFMELGYQVYRVQSSAIRMVGGQVEIPIAAGQAPGAPEWVRIKHSDARKIFHALTDTAAS